MAKKKAASKKAASKKPAKKKAAGKKTLSKAASGPTVVKLAEKKSVPADGLHVGPPGFNR